MAAHMQINKASVSTLGKTIFKERALFAWCLQLKKPGSKKTNQKKRNNETGWTSPSPGNNLFNIVQPDI